MSNHDEPAPRAAVPYPDRAEPPRPGAGAGPRAPVPPQPRVRWHVTAALVGLVVTPFGLWLLGLGMTALSPTDGSDPRLTGLLWVLGGAAALSVVAAVSALGSSLGLIVGGSVWGVLLGVAGAAGLLGEVLGGAAAGSVAARTSRAGGLLLPTGFLLTVGTVLVAAGVAVHYARRAGRRQERAEVALAAADSDGAPTAPVPPASRLRSHLASTAVALALLPLSLVMLSRAAGWLADVDAGAASWGSDPASVLALLAAQLCVAAVMLTAAASSLGPQLAGWLMAVLPGLGVVLHELTGWSWLDAPIGAVTRTPGSVLLVGTDFLLYLGVVTIVGGAAAHWARRHGRQLERQELRLAGM